MNFVISMLVALLFCSAGSALAQTVNASEDERAPTEQEELALTAMEGLMAQSDERALPIIKKVLAGSQTTLVKQRALFVLSQMDSPEAEEILIQTSRSTNAALRNEAIRSIGIGGQSQVTRRSAGNLQDRQC